MVGLELRGVGSGWRGGWFPLVVPADHDPALMPCIFGSFQQRVTAGGEVNAAGFALRLALDEKAGGRRRGGSSRWRCSGDIGEVALAKGGAMGGVASLSGEGR